MSYRIIGEVRAKQMHGFMGELTSKNHMGFIPRRMTLDNVIVVGEAFQSARIKKMKVCS